MKLNKIYAVALAVLAMTSCDDNNVEDYPEFLGAVNTASGVTVSMPSSLNCNENEAIVSVPVTVAGETNGKLVVTVEVKEVATPPAETEAGIVGQHFNVTSYTVNIPAGATEGAIEMTPVWETGVINDDRVFEMSIKSVEGATVENANCVVTIANVDDPYTALYGKWSFKADASNADKEYVLTIGGPDPADTEYYGKELYAYGLLGIEYVYLPLNFEYDEETLQPVLSIQAGTFASGYLLDFSGIGTCGVVGASDKNAPFGEDIPMTYTNDGTTETIKMTNMAQQWHLALMPYPDLNSIAGWWGTWQGISLSRKL